MKIIDALHQQHSYQYFDFIIWKTRRLKILLVVEFALTFVALSAILSTFLHIQRNNNEPLGFDYHNVYEVSIAQYDNTGNYMVLGGDILNKEITDQIKSNDFIEHYGEMELNEPYFQGYAILNFKIIHNNATAENVHFTRAGFNIDKVFKFHLITGRWFDQSEVKENNNVVVINQSLKAKLFKNESAVGKNITVNDNNYKVIGVVDHYKYQGEFSKSIDIIFSPFWFRNGNFNAWTKSKTDFFRVRPGTSIGAVNNLARILSLRFPDYQIELTPLGMERSQYINRIWGPIAAIFIVFTFVLLIVLLGQFGVLWYNISQRKTEIGIRRAIGANRSRIFSMILREMIFWASAGIIIGTLIFSQVPILKLYPVELSIYIYSILISAVAIYILVTLCSLIPGIQATKIRPAVALHEE